MLALTAIFLNEIDQTMKPIKLTMTKRPNFLILMTDQMQGLTLRPDHPLRAYTPHLNKLMERGVRFERAYTPNAICSPARASLMTGRLPHSHGITSITHAFDPDIMPFRDKLPHFAQRLKALGYRNGYFGKWHVEHTDELERFGWQTNAARDSSMRNAYQYKHPHLQQPPVLRVIMEGPDGYPESTLYQVDQNPPEQRPIGWDVNMALDYLENAATNAKPWCCFVSCLEPHDPFVCGVEAFELFDLNAIELPANVADDLTDRPDLYRRAADRFRFLTDRQKRELIACYWGGIVEIDQQYGRLLDRLDQLGLTDDTVIIFTSDHGEALGAHGLYMKNIGAFEETYHIPLVISGPGVAQGQTSDARVGLHDLAPTICELADVGMIGPPDSHSFASVLNDPKKPHHFHTGLAEFEGTRQRFTQRIVYDDRWGNSWKLVHNGFAYDELYNLATDPNEMRNLAHRPEHAKQHRAMTELMWSKLRATGDRTLIESAYPVLRLAEVGPYT